MSITIGLMVQKNMQANRCFKKLVKLVRSQRKTWFISNVTFVSFFLFMYKEKNNDYVPSKGRLMKCFSNLNITDIENIFTKTLSQLLKSDVQSTRSHICDLTPAFLMDCDFLSRLNLIIPKTS